MKMTNNKALPKGYINDEGEVCFPKTDPYYREMLQNQIAFKKKIRITRMNQLSQREMGNIFNHPLLKFYHMNQAMSKKESLDLEHYKFKKF